MNVSTAFQTTAMPELIAFTDRLSTLNKTILPYPAAPISFRTFPDSRLATGTHFRFVVSSCVTPNFPYVPFQGRRIKGFDLLARYLWPSRKEANVAPSTNESALNVSESELTPQGQADSTPAKTSAPPAVINTPITEFMLFLGDFVYADVPLYYGDDKEAYRRLYRRNYMSDSFRKVYERLRQLPLISLPAMTLK